MRNTMLVMAVAAVLWSMPLHAQQAGPASVPVPAAPANDGIRTEAAVVVEGEQPGPGLWLVRSPDARHELYILGTLSPLPAKMQWQSRQVEQVVAGAQEVIRSPYVTLDVKTGWFKGLLLLPKLLGARNNPDGKRLQDVVAPASYARWLTLKARYIGSDGGVEKMRPLFAAQELYGKAMKKNDLDSGKSIWPVIEKAIETHHPAVTVVKEEIPITDPKPLLAEWSKTTLDDSMCFDNTMTRIETDIDSMRARANAWATGDMAGLRTLPPAYQWEACRDAMTEAGIGKRVGFGDAQSRVQAKWMAAAETALGKNAVTFAMLPLNDLLGQHGYLAKLQQKGYTVIAPDE